MIILGLEILSLSHSREGVLSIMKLGRAAFKRCVNEPFTYSIENTLIYGYGRRKEELEIHLVEPVNTNKK